MKISTLAIKQISKEPCVGHAQDEGLVIAVTAVFQHRAVSSGVLRGIDQLPAVLDRGRRRDLYSHVFPMIHSGDRHLDMPVPRRRDDDQVKIAASYQRLEGMVALSVQCRRFLARL